MTPGDYLHTASLTTRQWAALLSRCEKAGRDELADAIRLALATATLHRVDAIGVTLTTRQWSILLGLGRADPRLPTLHRHLAAVLREAMDAARVVEPVEGESHIELVASERT